MKYRVFPPKGYCSPIFPTLAVFGVLGFSACDAPETSEDVRLGGIPVVSPVLDEENILPPTAGVAPPNDDGVDPVDEMDVDQTLDGELPLDNPINEMDVLLPTAGVAPLDDSVDSKTPPCENDSCDDSRDDGGVDKHRRTRPVSLDDFPPPLGVVF